MFLGFMVSHHGIEANLEKLQVILKISTPRSQKEVYHLAGWVTMLGYFVARSGDKCLHFFKALKQIKDFQWMEECQVSFEQVKSYLTTMPLLMRPVMEEIVYLYLAISTMVEFYAQSRGGQSAEANLLYQLDPEGCRDMALKGGEGCFCLSNFSKMASSIFSSTSHHGLDRSVPASNTIKDQCL